MRNRKGNSVIHPRDMGRGQDSQPAVETSLVSRPMTPQPCAGLPLGARREPSAAVSRVSTSIYRGHHLSKMAPAPGGSDLGVILQYPHSFGETQICRFSWDTLALSIHPPCLDSILVYHVRCGGWALAGLRLLIGPWFPFLSFLASIVPVKHRQVEGSVIEVALPLSRPVSSVSHEPFIMAQVTDGCHPPSSLGDPPAGFH